MSKSKPLSAKQENQVKSASQDTPSRIGLWIIFLSIVLGSMGFMTWLRIPPLTAPQLTYEVLNTFAHDETAFTQGLLIDNGQMYESTGRINQSSVRAVDLATGRPVTQVDLKKTYFGEGITIYGSKLYQLTFQNGKILVYDKDSLQLLEEKDFPYEGWGLTSDPDHLILSDGSATIRFLDPETFAVKSKITVRDGRRTVSEINELEYYDGRIYANVWHEDLILEIIPASGRISAKIDMAGLLNPKPDDREACLNGIAVDKKTNSFYVTGKLWPKLFEVKFVRKTPESKR